MYGCPRTTCVVADFLTGKHRNYASVLIEKDALFLWLARKAIPRLAQYKNGLNDSFAL